MINNDNTRFVMRSALVVGVVLTTPALAVVGLCWGSALSTVCCPHPTVRTCLSNQPGNPSSWDCTDIVSNPGAVQTNVVAPPLPGNNGKDRVIITNSSTCIRTARSCQSIAEVVPPDTGCVIGDTTITDCVSRAPDPAGIRCPGPPAPSPPPQQ